MKSAVTRIALLTVFTVISITAPSWAFDVSKSLNAPTPAPPGCGCAPICQNGQLGGQVWKDFNSDGIQQPFEQAGVAGITVTAYNCQGVAVGTTTTNSCGYYSFAGIAPAAYPLRVEFSNIPAIYNKSGTFNGSGSRTSVQRVASPTCGANLGVADPNEYCQADPKVVVPQFRNGDPLVTTDDCRGVGLAAPQTGLTLMASQTSGVATASASTSVSTLAQTGALWGVAYQKRSKKLFSSAVVKRHAGLGPQGLGGIYIADMTNNTTAPFVNASNLGINVGNNANFQNGANRDMRGGLFCPNADKVGFDNVGKAGIGDLDISDDGSKLYFVNLLDRKVYSLNIDPNNPTAGTTSVQGSWSVPSNCSNAGDNRPWGLKYYQGFLYVGTVCSAESSQSKADLKANVYKIDPNAVGSTPTLVLSFPLNYNKGITDNACTTNPSKDWNPWTLQFPNPCNGSIIIYPQPILSDIEFDGNGDMILGFLDRTGMQTGDLNFSPDPNTGQGGFIGFAGGDLLRAGLTGNTQWTIENNGSVTNAGNTCSTNSGNNGQGPGTGEYYDDAAPVGTPGDGNTTNSYHQDAAQGGIAMLPGNGYVITTSIDADLNTINAGGIVRYDNATGKHVSGGGYNIYKQDPGTFGKASGLGDIEALCDLPPLQIGNYVWLDADRDGIQDPCEQPLAGVNVTLYNAAGQVVATKTTNANGEYYFSSSDGLLPNTAYTIAFGTGGQYSPTGLNIGGTPYQLTVANTGEGANKDLNDSDATVATSGPANGFPTISVTTGPEGSTNHTLDAGFSTGTFDLALRKTTTQTTPVQIGQDVPFVITIFNQGTITAQNTGIIDYLPNGLVLSPNDANGWTLGTNNTTATHTITQAIAPGDSAKITILLRVAANAATGNLTNTAEITSTQDNNGVNRNLDDIDSTPDGFNTETNVQDNVITGNGKTGGDEDDHDIAVIRLEKFDLALTKVLTTTGAIKPGDNVTFTITVINQGTLDATNVQVTDYIPTGLTLTDAAWSTAAGVTATLSSPIATLAAGASTTRTITFKIDNNFQGASLVNRAEISAASNSLNLPDIDSKPDAIAGNDGGGKEGTATDDSVNGNGTGTPGDTNAATDEDDADPALATVTQKFDLALTKKLKAGQPAVVSPGDNVTFTITVINQGTLDATNVQVTDYIPTDMTLADAAWTAAGGNATLNAPIATLAAGASTTRDITLKVNPTFAGLSIVNRAEISAASNALNQPDIDSKPDAIVGNDAGGKENTASDDATGGNGTGTPGDANAATDEDDADPALVGVAQNVKVFDLALDKKLAAGQSSIVAPGDNVTFTITVYNQGTEPATQINLVDYIPTGMTLNDPNWTVAGGKATLNTPIASLAPGAIITRNIILKIDATFAATATGTPVKNTAEISDAKDSNGATQTDVDSTPDNTDGNQPGEVNPQDDVITGNGKTGGDEDDHDIAIVTVVSQNTAFDLALRKKLAATQGSIVAPGDNVTFTITVLNQGTVGATMIQVTDYLPAGTTLNDGGWTAVGGKATLNTPIASLAAGAITTVNITLKVDATFTGTSINNKAEISSAKDTNGATPTDVDSTPDNTDGNQPGEVNPINDEVNQNGKNGGDEDDHDNEPVTVQQPINFDLALKKTLAAGQPTTVTSGDNVTFTITVTNQGTIGATSIKVTDYIPTDMTLADPNWTAVGGKATLNTPIASLAPGASTTVNIILKTNASFAGTIINKAEISDAKDAAGNSVTDVDSTPDNVDGNSPGEVAPRLQDDVITENGKTTGDEDDHDIASVVVTPKVTQGFDLALTKTITPGGSSTAVQGSNVSFTITILNQGNVDAATIRVADYIPAGLILNDPAWTATGNIANLNTPIATLAAGTSTTRTIIFRVDPAFAGGSIINVAEITSATDGNGNPVTDVDSTPDNNPGNDGPATDNDVSGNAKDPNATDKDEDDSDFETIMVPAPGSFDLALKKTLATGQAATFSPGGLVKFTITVLNQGVIDATQIQVTDYIPTGLTLNDPAWVVVGGKATLIAPIASLIAGASTTVDIIFKIDANFTGTSLVNKAEISAAKDAAGNTPTDVDSTPDNTDGNTPGEAANLVDDKIDGNGKAGGDEDDHDIASVTITPNRFDLALIKKLAAGQPTPVLPGANVKFTISIINQGNVGATQIQVSDYIPTGFTLADPNWTVTAGIATLNTPIATLAAGATTTIDITLKLDANFTGSSITNTAEISSTKDANGNTPTDVDSTPDSNPNNDGTPKDDVVNEDGKNGGDEDDSDIETIAVNNSTFDLGLTKKLAAGQAATVRPGDLVKFTITVINQGTIDGTNIQVTDYIPTGLTLNDPNWSANTSTATLNTPIATLAAGQTTTRDITFRVDASFRGTVLVNRAEISAASNAAGRQDVDSSPDSNIGNDAGGKEGTASDDSVNGNGTGTPGDANAVTDEDDSDPALINVNPDLFDLALTKKLANGQSSVVKPNDLVTYTLTVINQGTIGATQIQVSDYLPTGVTLQDAAWTVTAGVATLNTPIASLAAGASTQVNITIKLGPTFTGALTNVAEISSVKDANGGTPTDIDSTPDSNPNNDGTPKNDVVNEDGKNGGDEDDSDPETITVTADTNIFDLALTKKLSPTQSTIVRPGDKVKYDITVYNQGTITATRINVVDYVPAGMTFNNADNPQWFIGTGGLPIYVAGPVLPGAQTTTTIILTVSPTFVGTSITNVVEIVSAADENGNPKTDIDSTPDSNPNNDGTPQDNVISGNGKAGGDEDDSDPETITITQFVPQPDLALQKKLATGQSSIIRPGDFVTFTINILNQGNIAGTQIQVTDYIPTGLVLADGNWTTSGNTATLNTPIASLAPQATTTRDIRFQVSSAFTGTSLRNKAEISSVKDSVGGVFADIDSKPDNIDGNQPGEVNPKNDVINENGNAGGDEDDHDFEDVSVTQVFDLALTKKLAPGQAASVKPGDLVNFAITVFNQGTLPATNIQVVDYVPSDMALADPTWSLGINNAATLNTPIASLAPGASTTVNIKLQVKFTFQGISLTNKAEILSASNPLNLPDIDSTPDGDPNNDPTINDEINKTPATGDEDDEDPETIAVTQIFDLALTKTLAPGQTGPFKQGDLVTYSIIVYNQGTLDAFNVNVTDYVPAGMTVSDPNWFQNGQTATLNGGIPFIGANQATIRFISMRISPTFQGNSLVNKAEVSGADNLLNQPDVDSRPDQNPNNDGGGKENSPSDNVITGNGTGTPGDTNPATDEDDEDPAQIPVLQTFDLALVKKLAAGQATAVAVGSNVTFTLTAFNQGSLNATNVQITDYIPAGFALNDPNWTAVGNKATLNTPIASILQGNQANVNIILRVLPTFQGNSLKNTAEISSASNALNLQDIDSTPDNTDGNQSGEINPVDNSITGDGKNGGDEDDHDIETIQLLPGSISGITWKECDNKGVREAGEKGIAGVTVTLNGSSFSGVPFSAIAVTPTTGIYNFPNVPAGNYTITFSMPGGMVGLARVPKNVGGNDAIDSDADITTGLSDAIVVLGGVNTPNVDAGYTDIQAPVFTTVPNNLTIECSDPEPNVSTTLAASDNCTAPLSIIITYLGQVKTPNPADNCPDSYTLTRTWRATDECANSTTVQQTITVRDTKAPTFTSQIPSDVTVQCDAIPVAQTLAASDNCDADVTVTFAETNTKPTTGCVDNYTIKRVWTATDNCGNKTTRTQNIQVIDTKSPEFINPPADITIECDVPVPVQVIPQATDNCDLSVTVTYIGEQVQQVICPRILIRTWQATDNCGNTKQTSQRITIQDTKAPVFTSVPANVTVDCASIPAAPVATATDNCSTPTVTYKGEVLGTGVTCKTLTRTWEATDACGNKTTATQVLTIGDGVAPTFTSVPTSVTVECTSVPPVGTATATDNCSTPTVSYLGEGRTSAGNCDNNYILTRTWEASDACGNKTTRTQTIKVQDTSAPTFTFVPADVTIACENVPTVGLPTATDGCSSQATITYIGETNGATSAGACRILNRTWTATDNCGNIATRTQKITIIDNQPPVFSGVPANVTVECDAVPAPAQPTASDNCVTNVTVVFAETSVAVTCENSYTIVRKWTATDACGNTATATQTLTVRDTKVPTFTFVPANTTLSCDQQLPTVGTPVASDNCDISVAITYVGEIKVAGTCVNNYTLFRTWEAADNCGNKVKATQTLVFRDAIAPTLTNVPADLVLKCNETPPTPPTVTGSDNCDTDVQVTFNQTETTDANGRKLITRTWTGFDNCGGSVTKSQLITINPCTPIFDLALTKKLAIGQPAIVLPGANVTFTITVFNQGNTRATAINVVDYIPTGFTLNDPNWTAVGTKATLNTPISVLVAGAQTTVDIKLTISPTFTGTKLTNIAEITSVKDSLGGPITDIDSTPDDNPTNDTVGSTPHDVSGNGNGGGDEDDHDQQDINVVLPTPGRFDLALTKTLASGQAQTVSVGDNVRFNVTVYNQGNVTATAIEVVDYIPTGLILNDPNWTAVGNKATLNLPIANLGAGAQTSVTIAFKIDPTFAGTKLTNIAEIKSAKDSIGGPVTDIDSTPDDNPNNDTFTSPHDINGDGKNGGDEDDSDKQDININPVAQRVFDLALTKTLAPGQSASVQAGSNVTFLVTVINQGNVGATAIQVVDYIPTGLTLNDPNWTVVGTKATLNTPIASLAAGAQVSRPITFTVNLGFVGRLKNVAEIKDAKDENGNPVTDIDSTPDDNPNNDPIGEDDKDDEEIEVVAPPTPIFDLALIKKLAIGQSNLVTVGSDVNYSITVYNQGTVTATQIAVVDYVPAGMTLNDPNWSLSGTTATLNTPIATLAAGAQTTVTIKLKVNLNFTGSTLVNTAEIKSANDADGVPATDIDSTPDSDPNNDTYSGNDNISGDGKNGGDEDDSDKEMVRVIPQTTKVFDLALTKTLAPGQAGGVNAGATVNFTITVFNQGNVPATAIEVVDYIPTGLTLNDANWTLVGNKATRNTPIASLAAGASTMVNIALKVDPSFAGGRLINIAEIKSAKDSIGGTVTDIDSTPDDNPNNDTFTSPHDINGDGKNGGDEDDHDEQDIIVNPAVCTPPSFTATAVQATCTGFVANNDAKLTISNIIDGTKVGFSVGTTFTGSFASATAISGTGATVATGLTNATTTYTIRVYKTENCFTDQVVTLSKKDCGTDICTPPSFTATAVQATCTGFVANNDARLTISSIIDGTKVGFSVGTSYSGTFASAVAISGTSATVATGLTNATTTYTIRVYKTENCFTDQVVTLSKKDCGTDICTPPSFAATAVQATCTGFVANNDARLTISNIIDGTRVGFSVGTSYSGTFASAVAISGTSATVATGLANATTTYTIRVYKTENCFTDQVVTLSKKDCGTDICTPPSFTATAVQATCTGFVANNDARLTISNIIDGTKVGFSVGSTFTGSFASAVAISGTSATVATGLTNAATTYTIRVYKTENCFTDQVVTLSKKDCGIDICTPPSFTATAVQVTCNGVVPNVDGKINISNIVGNAVRAGYSLGSVFTGTFASATAISGTSATVASGLPNPTAGGQTYTVRVYASETCFTDFTVTLLRNNNCVPPAPPACSLEISTVKASGCVCAGSSNTVGVMATITWGDYPAGQTIVVRLGNQTKIINPATTSSPATVQFTIPANSGLNTVTAAYADETCEVTKNFTITSTIDNVPPVITFNVPQLLNFRSGDTLTFECSNPPTFRASDATVTDNCDANPTIKFKDVAMAPGSCPQSMLMHCQWVATDACGNVTSVDIYVRIQDTKAPTLIGLPADLTVNCEDLPVAATVTATDLCDDEVNVLYSQTDDKALGCAGNYRITRTWTAQDDCGNKTVGRQVITVKDVTAPNLIGVPANVTVSTVNDIPALPSVKGVDNCSDTATVVLTQTEVLYQCDGKIITRKWTATDECGNAATKTQVITVTGSPLPIAGTATLSSDTACLAASGATILGTATTNSTVPAGYSLKYVLTKGTSLTIVDVKDTPNFNVTTAGDYRVHVLIYNPATLDLSTVQIGTTTGAQVAALLVQGGGTICGALNVTGSPIIVKTCTPPPPPACDILAESNATVQAAKCDTLAQYCLPIELADLSKYTVLKDGQLYTAGYNGCAFDSSFSYLYLTIPGQGATGPYELQSWKVNNQTYSGTFANIAELVSKMNTWDANANWVQDALTKTIKGGNKGNIYGKMNIIQLGTTNMAELQINTNLIPHGIAVKLNVGSHVIVVTDNATGCTDSVRVNVTCPQPPPTACGDLIVAKSKILQAQNCADGARLCVEIPFANSNRYTITDNNAAFTGIRTACSINGLQGISIVLSEGQHKVVFTDIENGCKDTITVKVICIQNLIINSTVFVRQLDTITLAINELPGTPISITKIDQMSGNSEYANLIPVAGTINKVRCAGVEKGFEKATFVIKDDLGFTDTTFFNITVIERAIKPIAMPDVLTTTRGRAGAIDITKNDTLTGAITRIELVTLPANGIVLLVNGVAVYKPAANFCGNDSFEYEVCTAQGCSRATVQVKVLCNGLEIFTGFSPNNDGINDNFVILGIENYPNNELQIFSRWGMKVFGQKDYQNDWNGRWNGNNLPDGTYFYMLDDGEGNTYTGYLQINR